MWINFSFFSCLIALAKALNAMLSKSGESEHPCFPGLGGSAFSFSPLSRMLNAYLSHRGFIEVCSFYAQLLK
jgi:hypothetical protein